MAPRNSRTIKVQGTVAPKTALTDTTRHQGAGKAHKVPNPTAKPAPTKSD